MRDPEPKTIVNLEQVRAAGAIHAADTILQARKQSGGGDQLSGYHSLIITNGLLATLAYSLDKGGECRCIAKELIAHLSSLQGEGGNRFLPGKPLGENEMQALGSMTELSSETLAMMTGECMAYLNYLKRFVRAKAQER